MNKIWLNNIKNLIPVSFSFDEFSEIDMDNYHRFIHYYCHNYDFYLYDECIDLAYSRLKEYLDNCLKVY